VLDIPDAAHYVSLFLGRAIVDEVLPPAFLTKVLQRLRDDSLGVQIVRSVGESPLWVIVFSRDSQGVNHLLWVRASSRDIERIQASMASPYVSVLQHMCL